MKKDEKKIVIPRPKTRGAPVPKTKVIPNPKKEAERRKAREKVDIEKESGG